MKWQQQLKEDKEKLQSLSDPKKKLIFIFDYYAIPIALAVVCVIMLFSFTIGKLTKKDVLAYAVLVNTDALVQETQDEVFDELMAEAGYNMKHKTVDVNKTLTYGYELHEEEDIRTLQVLTALFTISDLDLFVANKEVFDIYANENAYADLSLLIDQDVLNRVGDDLYAYTTKTGETVKGGIVLHPGSKLHEAGYFHDDVIIGLANKAVNFDEALDLILQIIK